MKRFRIISAVLIAAIVLVVGYVATFHVRHNNDEPGVVDLACAADFSTMDVAETSNDYMVPMNVFDRLFETRRIDGEATVVKSLCTDYSVSDDALRYDFVLRDGVVFSNGNALTASDVKYSFERLLRMAQQNTEIPEEVVGAEDVLSGKTESLAGFEVTDDTHFSITLAQPNIGFTAELSSPAMSIVDAETCESVEYFGHEPADTIGSGPYVITEWVANDHFVLEYNDRYWGEEPSVKKAIVHVIPDASTQNLMFQNGELDLINLGVLNASIVESDYTTNYADRIVTAPKASVTYFAFNETNEYLKDLRVRKAIAHAINIDSIVTNIYHGNARAEHGIIPLGTWGANEDLEGYAYDPDAARALLAEAGYADGEVHFELSFNSNDGDNKRVMCESMVSDLQKVGIDVKIKSYDRAAWVDKRISGEMESFVATWLLDYNDPANIMQTFFGSVERTAERSMHYPDTKVMARVAAASAIVDDDERKAEYQELEKKIAIEDCAWVALYEDECMFCLGERAKGFTPHWAGFDDFYVADLVLKQES